jgi:hypothetical protein
MPLNYRIQILLSMENKEFLVSTFRTIKTKLKHWIAFWYSRPEFRMDFLKCQINRDMPQKLNIFKHIQPQGI